MQGYNDLARKWGRFWTSSDSGQLVELTEIDFGKMNEASKKTTVERLLGEKKQYQQDVEEMANRIGPPKGCGYEFSSGGLEMETDPLGCEIKQLKAKQVEESVPCKDLYEIAFRHEVLHLQKCQARLSNKRLLTPAGLAREEAEGYKQEIRELNDLLKKLGCKGKLEYDSTSSITLPQFGTVRFSSKGFFPYEIDDNEKIKGDGTHTLNVDTSGFKCTISGYQNTYALNLEGEAEEEFLQFRFKPKPGYETLPSFRVSCPPGFGFSLPVPRGTGETRLEREDGARKEIDLAAAPAQGKTILTLHFEVEDKGKPIARIELKKAH